MAVRRLSPASDRLLKQIMIEIALEKIAGMDSAAMSMCAST